MKSIVICNNLLKKQSPAACIEQDLLDGLSCNGIDITAYCSSLGDLYSPSTHYKTIIGKEYKICSTGEIVQVKHGTDRASNIKGLYKTFALDWILTFLL